MDHSIEAEKVEEQETARDSLSVTVSMIEAARLALEDGNDFEFHDDRRRDLHNLTVNNHAVAEEQRSPSENETMDHVERNNNYEWDFEQAENNTETEFLAIKIKNDMEFIELVKANKQLWHSTSSNIEANLLKWAEIEKTLPFLKQNSGRHAHMKWERMKNEFIEEFDRMSSGRASKEVGFVYFYELYFLCKGREAPNE